mgnify:CR=1 FL=1
MTTKKSEAWNRDDESKETCKKVVMFDFDGTMIAGDSIADFVRFSFFRGKLSFARVLHVSLLTLLWKCGFAKVERVKSMALRHLGGMGEGGA